MSDDFRIVRDKGAYTDKERAEALARIEAELALVKTQRNAYAGRVEELERERLDVTDGLSSSAGGL